MGKNYVELKGLDIMQGDLRKIMEKMRDSKVKDILIKNAGFIADEMEARAPKHTGALAHSVRIFDSEKYKYSVMIAPDYDKMNTNNITAPALLSIIEFGADSAVAGAISTKSSKHRETNAQGYWRHMVNGKFITFKERAPIAARPFIRPAYDASKQKVINGITKDINKALKEAAKQTKTIG